MEGSTTYGGNSTTTRVTAPPLTTGVPDFLAEYVRRRLQEGPPAAAASVPAPPQKGAVPVVPVSPGVIHSGPDPRTAPRAGARPSGERHAFVANNHGMNQLGGYSEAPEGAGNFYGGYRVTDGNPGVHFANMMSRANTEVADNPAGAVHPSAQAVAEQKAVEGQGGDDWFSLPGFVRDKLLAQGSERYWGGRDAQRRA